MSEKQHDVAEELLESLVGARTPALRAISCSHDSNPRPR